MALTEALELKIEANGAQAVTEFGRVKNAATANLGAIENLAKTAGGSIGGLLSAGLGVGLGVGGVAAASAAVKDLAGQLYGAAKAAGEDNRAQAVLAATLRNTVGASRAQIGDVEDTISGLSRMAAVADDDLRPSFDVLVRSTHSIGKAQELLGTALNVSAGTGKDVVTVSTAIAKSYEGQTTALGRLVPEVAALANSGASADEIMKSLNRTFAGAAEAGAAADPIARLNITLGEMKETIGTSALPALTSLEKQLNGIAPLLGPIARVQSLFATPLSIFGGGEDHKVKDIAASLQALDAAAAKAAHDGLAGLTASFESNSDAATRNATAIKEAKASIASAFLGVDLSSSFESSLAALDEGTKAAGGRAVTELDIERANRSVIASERDLADAESNLARIRAGATADERERAQLERDSALFAQDDAQAREAAAFNDLQRAKRRGTVKDIDDAERNYTRAILGTRSANLSAKDAAKALNDVNEKGKDGSRELADAVLEVEDAQFRVREAIAATNNLASGSNPVAKSAEDQRKKFEQAATAAGEILDNMVKTGVPADVVAAKARELEDKLRLSAGKAGVTADEFERVRDALEKIVAYTTLVPNLFGPQSPPGTGPSSLGPTGPQQPPGTTIPSTQPGTGQGPILGPPAPTAGFSTPGFTLPAVPLPAPPKVGNAFPTSSPSVTNNFDFHGAIIGNDVELQQMIVAALASAQRNGFTQAAGNN